MALHLLLLAVILMFPASQGESYSSSCSTVNGKTICEERSSSGNSAMSSSSSFSGSDSTFQDVFAGAGNPFGNWASGRQTATGGFPPQQGEPQPFTNPMDFVSRMMQGAAGAFGGAFPFGRR